MVGSQLGKTLSGESGFAYIQSRLKELGATYYLLETWGNGAELYRFYCRVVVAGDNRRTRHFEATDPDPVTAMTRVLRDVERWRDLQTKEQAVRVDRNTYPLAQMGLSTTADTP